MQSENQTARGSRAVPSKMPRITSDPSVRPYRVPALTGNAALDRELVAESLSIQPGRRDRSYSDRPSLTARELLGEVIYPDGRNPKRSHFLVSASIVEDAPFGPKRRQQYFTAEKICFFASKGTGHLYSEYPSHVAKALLTDQRHFIDRYERIESVTIHITGRNRVILSEETFTAEEEVTA